MRRPKTLKSAKRRAWDSISRFVRQLPADEEGFVRCVTCPAIKFWKDMHCGHYQHGLTYGRDNDGLFVWVENLHPQCPSCNTYHHGRLDVYSLYMIDMYGREFTESLVIERHKPIKFTIGELWEIERHYESQLANQQHP